GRLRNGAAAVLALLIAPPVAANLQECQSGGAVRTAFGDFEVRAGALRDPGIVYVIAEADRHIFVCRVIVDLVFLGGCEERHALIYLQWLPGPQAFANLLGKAVRISRRDIRLLRHLASHLVIAMPIGGCADKN